MNVHLRARPVLLLGLLTILTALLVACQPATEMIQLSPTVAQAQPTNTLLPLPTDTLPLPPTELPQPTLSTAPAPAGLVVFYSERDGDADIYLMNPDGSDQRPITDNDADDTSPTWSPDGRHIAFESDRDDPHPHSCFPQCDYNLYVMNADGSDQHRLTSLPGAEWHASWSPDGRLLVFTAGDIGYTSMGIYTLSLDGGEPQPLVVDDFANDSADWSPDGTQIAFASNREGGKDIYVTNADGSGMRKVADTGLDDYFPDWSPDGTRLAFFAADWPTVRQDIYIVDLDGNNLINLTNTPNVVDEDPQWSPDGTQIIFQTDRDRNFEIYVMNADGSQPSNLTNHAGRDYWPAWWAPSTAGAAGVTPGSRIAFVSTRDGNGEIYSMNADGSDLQRLTRWSQWDGFPDWSPDGSQIAYYSYLSSEHWVIMVMNADGSQPRQLSPGESCDGAPHWSPDGTFITYDSGSCTGDQRDIFKIPVAGGELLNLSDNPADDFLAAWSPDGSQLVFTSDRDGNYEIYLMEADGSNVRRLTDTPAAEHAPAWSPDGTRIAFYSDRDGNAEIYLMNIDGSGLINLTNHSADDWFPRWSPDGTQITFSSWREGGLEIYVMNADGSDVRRLTDSRGENFNSVWQPTPSALTHLSDPYLGQVPPGQSPQLFAPGFISISSSNEYSAVFSPDGTEFYFTRQFSNYQNIYETHLVDGVWSEPAPVAFSARYGAHEPHITLDNKVLYFGWFRPVPEGESSDRDYGIWAVDRLADGWSEPRYVGQGMYVSSDRSGQLYVTDLSVSQMRISFVTLTDGRFTTYERITTGAHPCIAPDGSYLVYDYGGGAHLYVRFRLEDGTWGEEIDLAGQGLPGIAGIASISPDGLYMFYTDGHDIYWVSTEIITALR